MWSPRRIRLAALGLALLAPLALSGCTGLRPVYGDTGTVQQRIELNYAKPANRIDQIIIQELALRLGSGGGPDAPTVRISSAAGARALTRTGVVKPATQYEMSVMANFAVTTAEGQTLTSGTRRATATYTTNGQVVADDAAAQDATERAAREVAETIRLSLLAELSALARDSAALR